MTPTLAARTDRMLVMTVLIALIAACGTSDVDSLDGQVKDARPINPGPDSGMDAGVEELCPHRRECLARCDALRSSIQQCCDTGPGCSVSSEVTACLNYCCSATRELTATCAQCAIGTMSHEGGCNDFECSCFVTPPNPRFPGCDDACG